LDHLVGPSSLVDEDEAVRVEIELDIEPRFRAALTSSRCCSMA
jgi:hypothetical protein